MLNKKLGFLGERIAENYLKKKGYKILEKNYSSKLISGLQRGEIDIVAKKEKIIVFVEVKTLSYCQKEKIKIKKQKFSFLPEEKVNFQKQKKLIKTAENWFLENKIPFNVPWQLDIVSIFINLDSKKAKIRHIKNFLK